MLPPAPSNCPLRHPEYNPIRPSTEVYREVLLYSSSLRGARSLTVPSTLATESHGFRDSRSAPGRGWGCRHCPALQAVASQHPRQLPCKEPQMLLVFEAVDDHYQRYVGGCRSRKESCLVFVLEYMVTAGLGLVLVVFLCLVRATRSEPFPWHFPLQLSADFRQIDVVFSGPSLPGLRL